MLKKVLPLALALVFSTFAVADEAEIKAHVKGFAEKGGISKFAIPERVLIVQGIDKTSVGKINKKGLRQKFDGA